MTIEDEARIQFYETNTRYIRRFVLNCSSGNDIFINDLQLTHLSMVFLVKYVLNQTFLTVPIAMPS